MNAGEGGILPCAFSEIAGGRYGSLTFERIYQKGVQRHAPDFRNLRVDTRAHARVRLQRPGFGRK